MMAGYFSDNYGRKITIVVAITLNAFFWVLQGWLPSYAAFVVVRILVQGSNQAAYLTYNCYGKCVFLSI
jgi:MFS family permease